MDQLVELVAQRTGISADKAQTAVTTVIGFLKDKLPAPLAGQLDQFASGQGGAAAGGSGGLADVAKNVGGMFGNKS
jgi:hypothetical protein